MSATKTSRPGKWIAFIVLLLVAGGFYASIMYKIIHYGP